jgi:hypothetical protein
MISFATEFPISSSQTIESFFEVVCKWILGSPHTKLKPENLKPFQMNEKTESAVENEQVEVIAASQDKISAAIKYLKSQNDLQWITTIVFAYKNAQPWVSVKVACESSKPQFNIPKAKKPVLIKLSA